MDQQDHNDGCRCLACCAGKFKIPAPPLGATSGLGGRLCPANCRCVFCLDEKHLIETVDLSQSGNAPKPRYVLVIDGAIPACPPGHEGWCNPVFCGYCNTQTGCRLKRPCWGSRYLAVQGEA